jgi:pimeloyl-ACP methyl ester carboxylesterase
MSIPLHYAILCTDEIPYVDPEFVMDEVEDAGVSEAVIAAERGSMDMYFSLCEAWDLTPSGEISNEPVVSDIPTLIITGRFDPITPNFDGERLLDNLSNAVHVEIPTASHDPLDTSGECGMGIAVAFLESPRKELDTSCVDDLTLDMSPPRETADDSE